MGDISITGIGPVYIDQTEYVSREVLEDFSEYMGDLRLIMAKGRDSGYTYEPSLSDYHQVIEAVNNLAELARNGRMVGEPPNQYVSMLNGEMVSILIDVMKSLKLVGIQAYPDPPPDPLPAPPPDAQEKIKNWMQMSGFGIYDLVDRGEKLKLFAEHMVDPTVVDRAGNLILIERSPTRSLQSMMELEYIKTGNDIFFFKLESLDEALNITRQVLDTLAIVQSIANQITVSSPTEGVTLPTTTDIEDYLDEYKESASADFTQIIPVANPSDTAARELYTARLTLEDYLEELERINPGVTRLTSGSLAQAIYKVINDISTEFAVAGYTGNPADLLESDPETFETTFRTGVSNWIMDNEDETITSDGTSGAGEIQKRLTSAVRIAENLNDTQRDDVRRYLHIFEEFYKSAANMLTLIGELLSKINQGVFKQ